MTADNSTGGFVWRARVQLFPPTRVHRAMICYSLLLGARNTPAATQRFSRKDDATIRDITFRHFPEGFTVLNADGGWFDPALKKFVEEDSRQVLVCAKNRRQLSGWCQELARALKQKELLVVELGAATNYRVQRRGRLIRAR